MFEDELHCAQVNSSRDVTGGNRRAGAFYQANFPRSANALQERITAKGERNMGTEMRSMLISNTNLSSLQQLLASAKRVLTRSHSHLEVLEEQLKRAEVVAQDQVPVDVITINSQVRIHDLNVGRHTVYTLVFPRDADVARNRISVLARVGSALLGSRVGDLIECEAPGAAIRMRVGLAPTTPLTGTTKNQGEQCSADVHGTRFIVAGNPVSGTTKQGVRAAEQLRLLEHHNRRWDHADHQQFVQF